MQWKTVIGLEVHAQLATKTKLFSSAPTDFGASPNSQVNVIDAGLPGVLPVVNQEAINMAIQFGLATDASINNFSFFERKSYCYPDLPKGYQISQIARPIVTDGTISIPGQSIKITHARLEEDSGKSLHDIHPTQTGIDLNRAGLPLLEIVTAPCISSAKEAISYLKTLRELLLFLGICDGKMQAGSFRCDVNISVKPAGSIGLGTRSELKNLNSFRYIEQAILYEEKRHLECLIAGDTIQQETRQYNPSTGRTESLRAKETAQEYRYFMDPDLLPIQITKEHLSRAKNSLPELPSAIKQRLIDAQISKDDVQFLMASPRLVKLLDHVKKQSHVSQTMILNWLRGPYMQALRNLGLNVEDTYFPIKALASILSHVDNNRISRKSAVSILETIMLNPLLDVETVIKQKHLMSIHDKSTITTIIQQILVKYSKQVAEYQAGKTKLWAFFVGCIMKETQGKEDPTLIEQLLKKHLA